MENIIPDNKGQITSPKGQIATSNVVKLIPKALKSYQQASLDVVAQIEKDLTAPDNLEACESWMPIVEYLRDAALNGHDELEKAKITMFKAEPEFAKVYALYSPVPAAAPDQEEDRRIQTSETGVRTFRTSKIADLRKAKRAHWLINGILQERTVSLVYGDAGVGKTFITLDMALHLAIGKDWKGRAVRSAIKILYVYGEGDAGLRDRVSAWQQHFQYQDEELDNAYFLPFPVQVSDEREELCRTIEQIGNVGLVVFDTFSMCSAGVNENDNTSVAQWMNAAHSLKNRYGCTIVIVHHIGKSGDYRGASSFKGNIDCMIGASVGENTTTILVESKKQRDHEAFPSFYLERHTVDLGIDEETLETITSCVVLSHDRGAVVRDTINKDQLLLMEHIAANPGKSDFKLKTFAQANGISQQKYDARKAYMLKEDLIEIREGPRSAQLTHLTEKGLNFLSAAAVDGEV